MRDTNPSEWIDRRRHSIACVSSVALTAIGAYLLSMVPSPTPQRSPAVDDEALIVVWIERRPETIASRQRDEEPSKRDAASVRSTTAARSPSSVEHSATLATPAAETPKSDPPTRAPLDLRYREPSAVPTTAARAPWERVVAEDFDPPALLTVEVEDRSLFGAARRRECADLRAALSKRESTYAIVESMRKRGCK